MRTIKIDSLRETEKDLKDLGYQVEYAGRHSRGNSYNILNDSKRVGVIEEEINETRLTWYPERSYYE